MIYLYIFYFVLFIVIVVIYMYWPRYQFWKFLLSGCFEHRGPRPTEGAFQQSSQMLRQGVCLHDRAVRGRGVRRLRWKRGRESAQGSTSHKYCNTHPAAQLSPSQTVEREQLLLIQTFFSFGTPKIFCFVKQSADRSQSKGNQISEGTMEQVKGGKPTCEDVGRRCLDASLWLW